MHAACRRPNLISATDGAGDQTYFTYDGLGSTADLTDDNGDEIDDYTYDVFGAIRSQSGASDNYWLFTGEQSDSDEGLYYLRARYYDPESGRFLGRDPLPLLNRYTYVRNSPLNYIDPYGLFGLGDLNPIDDIVDCAKDPVECGEDIVEEGKKLVTETLPQGAEWTANQVAAGGEWVYQNAIVPVVEFLGTCEGQLLAGGVTMVAVGGGTVGLSLWAGRMAVASGTLEGLHAANQLGVMTWGGSVLGGFGGLTILDACLHMSSRFGVAHASSGAPPKE